MKSKREGMCVGVEGRADHMELNPRKTEAVSEMGSHCKVSSRGETCSNGFEQDFVGCWIDGSSKRSKSRSRDQIGGKCNNPEGKPVT